MKFIFGNANYVSISILRNTTWINLNMTWLPFLNT